jgi:hypothetical protein
MPSRPSENGRQVVGLIACRPSQARAASGGGDGLAAADDGDVGAPPATIRAAPWAMAWPEEEQALETAKTGPRMPNSIATALTGALTITRGTVRG